MKKRNYLCLTIRNYYKKNEIKIAIKKDFKNKNGLMSYQVYKKYLGGDYLDWLRLSGIDLSEEEVFTFKHRNGASNIFTKDEAASIILDKQKSMNRNLMYDDFRNPNIDFPIGISVVKKFWGTMNKMKEDLGLDINQEDMVCKTITSEHDLIKNINVIKEYMVKNNLPFITTRDINNKVHDCVNTGTFTKASKKIYGLTFSELMDKFDIQIGNQSTGFIHIFDDGEITESSFEYKFSTYLRELGFRYDVDYFRGVKYRDINNNYKGSMNCDYTLRVNDDYLYFEIAGMLNSTYYQDCYLNKTKIKTCKTKEKYRLKLEDKKELCREMGKVLFIILPKDINDDSYKNKVKEELNGKD